MKRLFLITILLLGFNISAFAQVENVAKDILTAYQKRDVELLKEHASAIFKVSLSESYFKDEAIKEDLKMVDHWDGEIKEVRYENKNIMGANVVMAIVYFSDVPGTAEINAVTLSNFNNTGWVIFGNGLSKFTKEEFTQLSKTAPMLNETLEVKPQKKEQKNFRVEMANGDTFDKVSEEQLIGYFNQLSDDNFYIILNNDKNYLQAAYSEKGYTVEYQDEKGHFTSHGLLSKDETTSLFRKYYQGKKDWRAGIVWDKD